jgi:LPS-assembly protein
VASTNLARIALAWICVLAAQRAAAQGVCLDLEPTPPLEVSLDSDGSAGEELLFNARQFRIESQTSAEFSDQVSIRYHGGTLTAERMNLEQGLVDVIGSVTFKNEDVSVFAEDAVLDRDSQELSFASAGFDMPKRPARGSAEQILVTDAKKLSMSSFNFTTCPADDTDWELLAREVGIDAEAGFGTARGVKLKFKGVPILYAPYFTFPIDDQRKSGFLTPQFADRDRTGLDISVPYYLNLAPNYDLTLEPRYLSKRGTQVNTDFRYLFPRSEGRFAYDYLADDEQTNESRGYLNLSHETFFGRGWQLVTSIEEVSDETYFEDLGDSLSVTSQTHLNQFLDIGFFAPRWSLLNRFQSYQTIDTFIDPIDRPYEQVPQMFFEGLWGARIWSFDSTTELVNFNRDVGVTGWRFDSTQELSLRFGGSGMFVTPAVAWRQTNYWLDDTAPGSDDTLRRGLPIGSLDTGFRFERDAGRTSRWIQTLEPRLLYVNVPFEDQSQLPVFDTIVPDFNLVQLFRKYQFVGPDRVADTDQLSFGVTTRLIEDRNGEERLSATLGRTHYLDVQTVSLPGQALSGASDSDYVAELGVSLSRTWNLDVGYQWDSETDSTVRAETRFEFRPRGDRVFGVGYRSREGLLEQSDVSMVWPLAARWRFIGQFSYSLLDEEPLERFGGIEYSTCCWRLRVTGRRYISSRTGETDNAISLQFELSGLTQRATAPEDFLDRGILGYRKFTGSETE